jgi:toxin ParE1/3/4
MAKRTRRLAVRISTTAADSLIEIWNWNAGRYGPDHADAYVQFVRDSVALLGTDPEHGRPVPTAPEFRYITVRRRPGGNGHVAVYQVKAETIELLDFFHTAQDWAAHVSKRRT